MDRRDVPWGTKILRARYVLRVKCDAQRLISRFKARLVALGHLAIETIHYNETYAPAARSATVKLVFAIAAIMNLELRQYDCETAFLNADIDEEIYMYVPDGYEPTDETPDDWTKEEKEKHAQIKAGDVVRLCSSIYGMPQSSRNWWKKITLHLKSIGFKQSVLDPGLMYRIDTKRYSVLALVVDDIVLATNEEKGVFVEEMRQHLGSLWVQTAS